MEKKPSSKQTLINKIKREKGITKGLSKLSVKELTEFDKTGAHASNFLMSVGVLKNKSDRRDILKLITRKRLVELVGEIRIKDYSKLKHDDLVNLIADKHWSSFHNLWLNKAKKDKKFLPDTYYSKNKVKKTVKPKVEKEDKKEVKKEVEKKFPLVMPTPEKRTLFDIDTEKIFANKGLSLANERKPPTKKQEEEATKSVKKALKDNLDLEKSNTFITKLFTNMRNSPTFYKKNKDAIDKISKVGKIMGKPWIGK